MESNIAAFVSGKNVADIAGSEVSHVVQRHRINWGGPVYSMDSVTHGIPDK